MTLTKKNLKKLKEKMTGHYSEVASRAGVTPEYVGMVLNGKRDNLTVIEKSIEYAKELEQKSSDFNDQVNQLK